MKYMLTFHVDQGRMQDASPAEMQEALARWSEFDRAAIEAGVMIACEALSESSTATTVEVAESGERIVTDGPFAEAKEQVGGFALLECTDLDQALDWARRVPIRSGAVEVTPVRDYSEYGYESPTPAPVAVVRAAQGS